MAVDELAKEETSNGELPPECGHDAGHAAVSGGGDAADPGTAAAEDFEEYITVHLNEIRKEMQCPICLGIIRKTRTVMECLHRFCRECIDKSMRLGNNECPACRTHCASRRSLRDDPNFDSLIAALYEDIDKYEEEEMALLEEETHRNKQVQANIAETFKRQSEALAKRRTAKATAAAIVRKAHGKFRTVQGRRGRGGRRRNSRRDLSPLEDESDEYAEREAEDTPPRRTSTRKRQRPVAFDSSLSLSAEDSDGNSDDEFLESPSQARKEADEGAANGDAIATWATGGTRSHSRYGSVSNRQLRCMRATVLLEALAAVPQKDIHELDVQFSLQPFNDISNSEKTLPALEKPYLCCSSKVSVQQLCSFLMSHDVFPVDTELEIVAEKVDKLMRLNSGSGQNSSQTATETKLIEVLDSSATLGDVYVTYWNRYNNLTLLYRRKN